MSTRSQIAVEGSEIKVYKHCDGYPEGVLPWLVPMLKDFIARRGFDEAYMLARIVCAVAKDQDDPSYLLGLGVDCVWHGDIEWAYVVRQSKVLEVHKLPFDTETDGTTIVETIPLT